MSSLAGRLRSIVRPGSVTGHGELSDTPSPPGRSHRQQHEEAADALGGEWQAVGAHRFLGVHRSYAPGHRHGDLSIADALPPDAGWSRLPLLAGKACGGRLLFVDLETTGLAGGAGSYAFLVGCGWFDGGRFEIRQFLLSSFSAEQALLEAVTEIVDAAETVVTYNGKSFDLPLIETRYTLHRLDTPFDGMPHVDMLHHARRLWQEHDEGCRLIDLEAVLLGHEREGDVPGFEIPSRYFHFVHTGDARPLGAVLEHNRLDLLSLAMLTARVLQRLEDGALGASTAREAFGMGLLYERAGLNSDALACFDRAADMGPSVMPEALRASAVLLRRGRRYQAAAEAWQRVLELGDCPSRLRREATEALAVHHEHRLRDPRSARHLALQSLQLDTTMARRQATEHRLARLDRKLGYAAAGVSALF
jgi:uncharacterized protein YprB with RNaseH-like and TPR domain